VTDNPVCWTKAGTASGQALQRQDRAGVRGLDPLLRITSQQDAPAGHEGCGSREVPDPLGGGEVSVDIAPAEYLAAERRAATRSEYVNGKAYAMAGASREHITIVANLA
jgi:hypothetical protein